MLQYTSYRKGKANKETNEIQVHDNVNIGENYPEINPAIPGNRPSALSSELPAQLVKNTGSFSCFPKSFAHDHVHPFTRCLHHEFILPNVREINETNPGPFATDVTSGTMYQSLPCNTNRLF